jgi:aminoglycoside 2'-N-acetyltransferase I
MSRLRRLRTDELTPREVAAIRDLLWSAFGTDEEDGFTEDDWEHAVGGVHVVLDVRGRIAGHASVVERELRVAGQPLRTGYVEAVAAAPDLQGTGLGTRVMREVNAIIRERFELGGLGAGVQHFYERLGWRTWQGPSSVRAPDGEHATPGEDGYIMVLHTPATPPLDPTAPISCDWRKGDVW